MKILKKKYHWYEVRFTYKSKTNLEIFNWQGRVALIKRVYILNDRLIKKLITPLNKMDVIPKNLLRNGVLYVETVCYLGRFAE